MQLEASCKISSAQRYNKSLWQSCRNLVHSRSSGSFELSVLNYIEASTGRSDVRWCMNLIDLFELSLFLKMIKKSAMRRSRRGFWQITCAAHPDRKLHIQTSCRRCFERSLLYESFEREPGWRFTARVTYGTDCELVAGGVFQRGLVFFVIWLII